MWRVGLFIGKFFLSLHDLSRVREKMRMSESQNKTKLQ